MHIERGGAADGPVLVLLHGLGGTGAVWDGVVDLLGPVWPGGWVVADLPGHGRSPVSARYTFGGLAASVADAVAPLVGDRDVHVLGHSLGGVVALALGSGWFGLRPVAVTGLGVKVRWTDEEVAKAASLAARPPAEFATRDEAEARAAKIAGLREPSAAFAASAVVGSGDGYRLALDPGAFGVGRPEMEGLLAACRSRAVLAAGEGDPMSPLPHLEALVPDPVILSGVGHNAHVEAPASVLPLIEGMLPPR